MTKYDRMTSMFLTAILLVASAAAQEAMFTQEEVQAARSYLTSERGFEPGELSRLKEQRPAEYAELLRNSLRESRELARLKTENPETYARVQKEHHNDAEIRKLARQYRSANEESRRKELRDRIRQLASKQFDVREERRKEEIRRLEMELKRLKETAPKRLAHKEEIVSRHLDELLGDADLYAW